MTESKATDTAMNESDKGVAVPLIEQLRSVPRDAVLSIDTPNALGCMDTRSIPIGRLCHDAAAALSSRDEATADAKRLEWLGQCALDAFTLSELVQDWKWNGKRYPSGLSAAVDAALASQRTSTEGKV